MTELKFDPNFWVKMTQFFRFVLREKKLKVDRMWDFQYSRMRILHFNIRGYRMRMRILYISLNKGYENEFRPQMMKKTQKIMQLLN